MREVLPGVFHWIALHPRIHVEASSHWLGDADVLIDPLTPPDVRLEWFDFDHLLLAHGGPAIGDGRTHDGRTQLQELVDGGGRTAFEL